MPWPIAVTDFKGYFTREFSYGATSATVQDADITRALSEAAMVFNESLWQDDTSRGTAYLYLSAHYMVLNIQGAGGLSPTGTPKGARSDGGGVISSKSVGSVSLSYAIPQSIVESPTLSQYMRTAFGQRYLSLLAPRLVGNVSVFGPMNTLGPYAGE